MRPLSLVSLAQLFVIASLAGCPSTSGDTDTETDTDTDTDADTDTDTDTDTGTTYDFEPVWFTVMGTFGHTDGEAVTHGIYDSQSQDFVSTEPSLIVVFADGVATQTEQVIGDNMCIVFYTLETGATNASWATGDIWFGYDNSGTASFAGSDCVWDPSLYPAPETLLDTPTLGIGLNELDATVRSNLLANGNTEASIAHVVGAGFYWDLLKTDPSYPTGYLNRNFAEAYVADDSMNMSFDTTGAVETIAAADVYVDEELANGIYLVQTSVFLDAKNLFDQMGSAATETTPGIFWLPEPDFFDWQEVLGRELR